MTWNPLTGDSLALLEEQESGDLSEAGDSCQSSGSPLDSSEYSMHVGEHRRKRREKRRGQLLEGQESGDHSAGEDKRRSHGSSLDSWESFIDIEEHRRKHHEKKASLALLEERESGDPGDHSEAEDIYSSHGSSLDSWDSFMDIAEHRQRHYEKRQGQQARDRKLLETHAYLLMHSAWYSRGWKFQEAMFSKRKIVFQNDSVNWECHCTAHFEGQTVSTSKQQACGKKLAGELGTTAWPDLYRYARLVCLFNRRVLTYPEDALYAFAGVLSHLSRTFKFGFISGLPQMFFHSTLIWQPYRSITRRVAIGTTYPILPSWSWAGWHGIIQSESWRSGYAYITTLDTDYDFPPSSWRTFETVAWFRLDSAGVKHAIKSLEADLNSDQSPDPDWQPTERNEETVLWKHNKIADIEFWQPVPLRDPLKAHVAPAYARYITALTYTATVTAGESFRDTKSSYCISVDLVGPQGEWIGVLRLPTTEPFAKAYELVELSRGSVRRYDDIERDAFDEWERTGFDRCWTHHPGDEKELYQFYNVMAISWKGGFAYREAVGRVEKSSWDAMQTTEKEIILG